MNINIVKRNGKTQPLKLDKITTRIKKQLFDLDLNYLNPDMIAISVVGGLFEGATTRQIDELIAEQSASKATSHPDYSKLASRILVSSLHKDTEDKFSNAMLKLVNDNLISTDFYNLVEKYSSILDDTIKNERDFNFDYFGFKTLQRSYLLKDLKNNIVERPQYLYMRIALAICKDNIDDVIKTYDLLSEGYYTHATPTMFNAGTNLQQLSSCFLLKIDDDSLDEIYKILSDTAKISKLAGGIGISISKIRAKNSKIKGTNGLSDGIIPMLKVYNETARYVNQSGKRKGSFAIYIEPWHDDIFDFVDLRKNHGKEEMRARDLFLAIWTNDLFMEAVVNDTDWYLMCPNESPGLHDCYGQEFKDLYEKYIIEGNYRRKIKARDLWSKIIENQIETGVPYILHKDSINEKSNQKNIGVISSSNLCVAPETQILTDKGYISIGENEGKMVNVWNGKQWSETQIVKTGENKELITIEFSDGSTIDCTPYHKFYVQKGYNKGSGKNKLVKLEKRANELEINDKLIKYEFPIIDFNENLFDAYTQGFFSGDGCSYKGNNHIDLFHEKNNLLPFLNGFKLGKFYEEEKRQRIKVSNDYVKFFIPIKYNIKSRLDWFAGLCDADGTICRNEKTLSLQLGSTELDFLKDIKLMLNTLGVSSKITLAHKEGLRKLPNHKDGLSDYYCKNNYRLLIGFDSLVKLKNLGFSPNRLILSDDLPNRNCEHFVKVKAIYTTGRISDTYCVNEPLEHKVIFNGILTGNCAEIVEYTSKEESAVCNLSSIGLPKLVNENGFDFNKLYDVAYMSIKNLDRVIDINYYPTNETQLSNSKHRPVGSGINGLADVFAMLKLPFDSVEAKELSKKISETIYFASLTASNDLAIEKGKYSTFDGSPTSKGILQYDMWENRTVANNKILNSEPIKLSGMWDFDSLKEKIIKYGLRNSLLTTILPSASTAQILGNNECIEPFTSNIYSRKTLSGEFVLTNKHLIKELIDLKLWSDDIRKKIIINNGSVQNIEEIPSDIRYRYRTVWEMKMKDIIDMSADRAPFICQTQSLNLFFKDINYAKLTGSLIYGWLKGLKTGSYYIRQDVSTKANNMLGIDTTTSKKTEIEEIACSLDNPEDCLACSA
jgi:ribonucleoside-diphosphate reductase alpha chain